eukprot:PhF_6_TR19548/c0_g1_i2/m.28513
MNVRTLDQMVEDVKMISSSGPVVTREHDGVLHVQGIILTVDQVAAVIKNEQKTEFRLPFILPFILEEPGQKSVVLCAPNFSVQGDATQLIYLSENTPEVSHVPHGGSDGIFDGTPGEFLT